jgi:hypothetical protein
MELGPIEFYDKQIQDKFGVNSKADNEQRQKSYYNIL